MSLLNQKFLSDDVLGNVLFYQNRLAKRYIIRIKPEGVSVTVPRYGSFREAEKFFAREKAQIVEKYKRMSEQRTKRPSLSLQYDETDLRIKAKQFLPQITDSLAKQHKFEYQTVTIRNSKTRWGSCSTKKNISLSLYLMTLPEHLIHYVILHELCHTVEMNHGQRFWNLLDRVTDGRAMALRKELKASIFPL